MKKKKVKTPRTGKPPIGFVRMVIDYPISEDLSITWDIDRGHCISHRSSNVPYGNLIRLIKRTEDGGF